MSTIEIRNAHKWFGSFHVLKEVNFCVDPGQVVVICGPSGSGKSTLLRCINYLEPIQQGEVFVKDLPVNEQTARQVRQRVGMVFQHFELFPHMTVLENCLLGPTKAGGVKQENAEKLAYELLARVGVKDKAYTYPASLSGGQKQRAAIVRALCLQPDVLLFDEPTSALDPEMITEVLDVMTGLAQEGTTMVVVTHEMGFARQVANGVAYMDQGTIVEQNDPESFFTTPQSEATQRFLEKIIH